MYVCNNIGVTVKCHVADQCRAPPHRYTPGQSTTLNLILSPNHSLLSNKQKLTQVYFVQEYTCEEGHKFNNPPHFVRKSHCVDAYMSTPSDAHLYNLLEKSIKSIRNP